MFFIKISTFSRMSARSVSLQLLLLTLGVTVLFLATRTSTPTEPPYAKFRKPRSLVVEENDDLINPNLFNFIILEPEICSKLTDLFLVTVVHSKPTNFKERSVIRDTWGSHLYYTKTKNVVIFVLGLSTNESVQMSIEAESEKYGDIIQQDFVDSYRNLTYKAVMWLRWVSLFCKEPKFVLKVDDDILVNVFTLSTHLRHVNHYLQDRSDRIVLCLLWKNMKIIRRKQSKWHVSEKEYEGKYFPPYCSGAAYVISRDLVALMYKETFGSKFFWIDDLYVTGFLPKNLNATYINARSLYSLKSFHNQNALIDGFAIFGHLPTKESKRYEIWNEILQIQQINS